MTLAIKEIKLFQQFLIQQGFLKGEADGIIGRITNQAVREFQKFHGLVADGDIGSRTLNKAIQLGYKGAEYPSKPTSIKPLSKESREKIFGKFKHEDAHDLFDPDRVMIKGGWEQLNIVTIPIPQLKGIPMWENMDGSLQYSDGNIRVHRLIANQTIALFKAWEDAGLMGRVLSYAGAFYPRYMRGYYGVLSNHSWGTAFDINAEYNGLNKTPTAFGEKGCVRELAEIAVKYGFYWGGWFNRKDGMHFEAYTVLK